MRQTWLWSVTVVALTVALSSVAGGTGITLQCVGGSISAGAGGYGVANGAVYHPGDPVSQQAMASAVADITNNTYDGSGCTTHTVAQETCSLADWTGNQPQMTHDGSVTATGRVEFYQYVMAAGMGMKNVVFGDIGPHTATRSSSARATAYAAGGNPAQPSDTGLQSFNEAVAFTVEGWGGMGGGMGMMSVGTDEGDLNGLLQPDEQS